jgi:hypothetical protein
MRVVESFAEKRVTQRIVDAGEGDFRMQVLVGAEWVTVREAMIVEYLRLLGVPFRKG